MPRRFAIALTNQSASYIGPEVVSAPNTRVMLGKFNVSAVPGVDTVQFVIQGKQVNATPGQEWYTYLAAAISAATRKDLVWGAPEVAGVAGKSVGQPVPAIWRVVIGHVGVGAFNYEIEVDEL